MRFHVLGIGSIGTLVSHHLRLKNPDVPISLIVRAARAFPSTRVQRREDVQRPAISLAVTRSGQTTTSQPYDQEVYTGLERYKTSFDESDAPYGPIRSLIVCLKTPDTLSALSKLKHRISPDSVVALLQNGMGMYDELCAKLWPEPSTRPFFLLGTITHGVTPSSTRGQVTHMSREGEGDVKWGIVPDPRRKVDLEMWAYGRRVSDTPVLSPPASPTLPLPPLPSSSTDLSNLRTTLSALLSLDSLNSTLLPMPHIHHTLLLKLALNANINPLTAILGAGSLPNGSLIGSSPSHRLIRMLSGETSAVIHAYLTNLHAPSSPPADVLRLYSRDNLISRTLALCNATARNSSSMAVDASAGRMTEIDYINGYLVSLGDRLGIPTPHHQMVREMVKFTSEVLGLKAETWISDTKRVARRKRRMSAIVRDTRMASEKTSEQATIQPQVGQSAATGPDAAVVRISQRRHAKRRAAEEKRKRQLAEKPSSETDGTASVPPSAIVEPVAEAEDLSPADLAHKKAMLAQLDVLGRHPNLAEGSPVTKADTAEPGLQHESRNANQSEPVELPEEEEQDEAIRAIESRIFSRSGRRGF